MPTTSTVRLYLFANLDLVYDRCIAEIRATGPQNKKYVHVWPAQREETKRVELPRLDDLWKC
jgi:hypothetical protein